MDNLKILTLKTDRPLDFYDITDEVKAWVLEQGIKEGIVLIYTPHTTAAITINENADPSVRGDIREFIRRKVPRENYFNHGEGNSPAHIMSSLFSASETIVIHNGQMILGTWQGIFFCEFDGPRSRRIILKCIGG